MLPGADVEELSISSSLRGRYYFNRQVQLQAGGRHTRSSRANRLEWLTRQSDALSYCVDIQDGQSAKEVDLDVRKSALYVESSAKHPFESCFIDLGGHSAERALTVLTAAVHAAQHEMNAFDWITNALRGATLKPALAFGTVGELYRSYTRPAELGRLKTVLRS